MQKNIDFSSIITTTTTTTTGTCTSININCEFTN